MHANVTGRNRIDTPPHDPNSQEAWRALVAAGAFALFGLVVGVALARAETWEQAKDLLAVILPIFTLILGGTIGYYYGRSER